MRPETPYNPLDKLNLGVSVADALLSQPIERLPPDDAFQGAGIYALYYTGQFEAYAPIVARDAAGEHHAPIYVGKAIPPGGRRGGLVLELPANQAVYNRLREHAESIEQALNLDLRDFACRYLIVDDIWIPLGENLLIARYRPVWNTLVDGFGNHDPGQGRRNQKRSSWDVLHPGRAWAQGLQPHPRTAEELAAAVAQFLQALP